MGAGIVIAALLAMCFYVFLHTERAKAPQALDLAFILGSLAAAGVCVLEYAPLPPDELDAEFVPVGLGALVAASYFSFLWAIGVLPAGTGAIKAKRERHRQGASPAVRQEDEQDDES
ncbi:MAG: hypothetical protein ACP5HU_09970 [Phycisphaerae bacterium]